MKQDFLSILNVLHTRLMSVNTTCPMRTLIFFLIMEVGASAWAHSWTAEAKPVFNEELRAHILAEWRQEHAQKQSATPQLVTTAVTTLMGKAPAQAAPFVPFAPKVEVKWDDG